jgi:hypothetical protein
VKYSFGLENEGAWFDRVEFSLEVGRDMARILNEEMIG